VSIETMSTKTIVISTKYKKKIRERERERGKGIEKEAGRKK